MSNSGYGKAYALFIDPARGLFAPTVWVYISKYYWSFLKDLCFILENGPFSFFRKSSQIGRCYDKYKQTSIFVMTFANKKQAPGSGCQTPGSGGTRLNKKNKSIDRK